MTLRDEMFALLAHRPTGLGVFDLEGGGHCEGRCRERFVSCLDCFMEGSAVFFVCVFDVWFILLVGGRFWVLVA